MVQLGDAESDLKYLFRLLLQPTENPPHYLDLLSLSQSDYHGITYSSHYSYQPSGTRGYTEQEG
jgi:hypothetical protein